MVVMVARRNFKRMSRLFIAGMLTAVSITAPASTSQFRPFASRTGDPAPARPYAQLKWVRIGDVVPLQGNVADVDIYVRLIAIEGEVLLANDAE